MGENEGNNLHMDCASTTDNGEFESSTLDVNNGHSAAVCRHINENNFSASGNSCPKKMKIDFTGSGNVSIADNTSMNAGCMMGGDQISGADLNMRTATIPQSMPTISSNSMENITGQMSENEVGVLAAIQRPPANISHVLKNQVDAARRLPYDGQTPQQQQQMQQASSDRDLNGKMMQLGQQVRIDSFPSDFEISADFLFPSLPVEHQVRSSWLSNEEEQM